MKGGRSWGTLAVLIGVFLLLFGPLLVVGAGSLWEEIRIYRELETEVERSLEQKKSLQRQNESLRLELVRRRDPEYQTFLLRRAGWVEPGWHPVPVVRGGPSGPPQLPALAPSAPPSGPDRAAEGEKVPPPPYLRAWLSRLFSP